MAKIAIVFLAGILAAVLFVPEKKHRHWLYTPYWDNPVSGLRQFYPRRAQIFHSETDLKVWMRDFEKKPEEDGVWDVIE